MAKERLAELTAEHPNVATADNSDLRGPAPIDVTRLEADVPDVTTELKVSGIYEVRRAGTRSAAMTYLRARQVREEEYYVIVETPEGNIGRNLIVIFEERSGQKYRAWLALR